MANSETVELVLGERVRIRIAMEGVVVESCGNAALKLADGSIWACAWPGASAIEVEPMA